MSSADQRGWGPGWPTDNRGKCVWVNAGGIKLFVRKEVAPIFAGFCDEVVARGYPLGQVADDWGYANRPIRGTQTASNHSWGLAIDLNSTNNPMGDHLVTDMPMWMVTLAYDKYGLSWGGNYKKRPDAMHYEFLGTPAEAAMIVARLQDPAPTPTPTPTPQENDDMKPQRIYNLSGPAGTHAHLVQDGGIEAHWLDQKGVDTWLSWGAVDNRDRPYDASLFFVLDGPLKTP